jgi:hypothetical protein
MRLTSRQERDLAKITQLVEAIHAEAKKADGKTGKTGSTGRKRRSAEDAAKMRSGSLAERAKGTSAAKLAAKYGVSTAYIYMMKG